MATSSKVVLTPSIRSEYAVPNLTKESAERASQLLQENHERHDLIFRDSGVHNHIVHHILTSFALGADPNTLQKHYDNNASYQRAPPAVDDQVVQDFQNPAKFLESLSTKSYCRNYLVFFEKELEEKGYEKVLKEYVFKGDERANVMFARLYSGFLHPMIHLGFGVEFGQPTIIAEALALACIHPAWQDPFLFAAEETATRDQYPSECLVRILDNIRADKKLSTAAHWDDDNKIRDGIILRAKQEMVQYASQWRVDPEKLEEATAEMINAAIYFTAGAQRPPKQVKFDFYYMHSVNCSIFFSSFLKQPWISTANKVKLLEWKGRLDLCLYASRRSPTLLLDEITNYVPKHPQASDWDAIIERAKVFGDDGHACKFVRALAHAEQVCAPWEHSEKFRIKGKMWLQLGNMAIDSVEDTGDTWVRSAGFDEAWEK
ncbi:MAG: hypothetical protein M1837_001481 [Sclerophora amabilis]|nr:MAG: hypothetical protein M1837_001481 [Sclerophora amabilis]